MGIYHIKGGWKYYIPALIWGIIIIFLSLMPSSSLNSKSMFDLDIPNVDKIVHLIFYFGMSFAILWGIYRNGYYRRKYFFITIIACSLMGIVIEVLQQMEIINRHFDMLDIIANIIGTLLGSVLFLKFFKLLPNGN